MVGKYFVGCIFYTQLDTIDLFSCFCIHPLSHVVFNVNVSGLCDGVFWFNTYTCTHYRETEPVKKQTNAMNLNSCEFCKFGKFLRLIKICVQCTIDRHINLDAIRRTFCCVRLTSEYCFIRMNVIARHFQLK